jgi:type II restriction/modification system DNA methylase subunit YeeA
LILQHGYQDIKEIFSQDAKCKIYWLFSSGKHKAFECLVYLHRYNEATLSRMRGAYVTPLQGKLNARIGYLRGEVEKAGTSAARKKLEKELEILKNKQAELARFDEELRHYADQKISLDLDDGVKVNYGKFGNLLAEKKAVTGE